MSIRAARPQSWSNYFLPVESGRNPLFERLGTATGSKRHVVDEDHGRSLHSSRRRNRVIAEVLAWFDTSQPQPPD